MMMIIVIIIIIIPTTTQLVCIPEATFMFFFQIYFIDLQLSRSETTQNNLSPLNIGLKVLRLSVAENSTIYYYHYNLYYYTYYCYHYYCFCIKKRSEMYWFVRLYGVAMLFTVNRKANTTFTLTDFSYESLRIANS